MRVAHDGVLLAMRQGPGPSGLKGSGAEGARLSSNRRAALCVVSHSHHHPLTTQLPTFASSAFASYPVLNNQHSLRLPLLFLPSAVHSSDDSIAQPLSLTQPSDKRQ